MVSFSPWHGGCSLSQHEIFSTDVSDSQGETLLLLTTGLAGLS
jgi:hypothetical protein